MNLASDWPYIQSVASARLKNNGHRKHHVSLFGDVIEIAGAAGELAARRYFSLPEKLHTQLDGGIDFTWRSKTFDVKTVKLFERTLYYYLQWPTGKPFRADFILVVGVDRENKEAAIIGYTTRDMILKSPINPERPIPCYELPLDRLWPVWKLFC